MSPIAQLHNDIYSFLLEQHQKNPSFYFAPRTKSETNGRGYKDGYWLNGNDDYIFIGLYKPNDGNTKTRSIGLKINLQDSKITSTDLLIICKENKPESYKNLYSSIIKHLQTQNPFKSNKKGNFFTCTLEHGDNWQKAFITYIKNLKPQIDELIKKFELEEEFNISDKQFIKYTTKISNHNDLPIFTYNTKLNNTFFMPNYPLNQILYGPPGTGKTYQTVALAYKIVHHLPLEGEIDYTMARTWYKQELAKGHDRQVEFITFHQNYSYEDFIAGIKPALNDDTLGFREHKGIFFEVCQRALKNYVDSQKSPEILEEEKSEEELFNIFRNSVTETLDNDGLYPISEAVSIIDIKDDAFVYLGHNWNHNTKGIQMKFKDILLLFKNKNAKDRQSALLTPEISGLAQQHISWYFTMVKKFRSFVDTQNLDTTTLSKKIPLKNYILIIDEINRANISRVFGELITLLEEDKRWGNDFETEVLLPDGFTKFTVPKNLYIIGTMNTADKSIALLDIALRRRFEFIPLYPDVSKVKDDYQVFFSTLNQSIKDKKGVDFCIGHAYFMPPQGRDFDFVKVMNQKVIPLLTEYFYNARTTQNDVKQLLEYAFSISGLPFRIEENMFQIMMVGS